MLSVTLEESDTCVGFELKKSVSWKGIFIREYDVTVGDHPLCRDNLPLSLDWSHSNQEKIKNIDCGRERMSNYVFPKRLSYEDRRRRIFGDPDQCESKEQPHRASTQVTPEKVSKALMSLDKFLEKDKINAEASKGVIYCRHVRDAEEDEKESDEDSLAYFLNWRRVTEITGL